MKIQDWAKDDRPREKMLDRGGAYLTDVELLAILLGSGTKDMSAVDLARRVLKQANYCLDALSQCSAKDLQKFKGIGVAKSVAVAAAMELGRRRSRASSPDRLRLHDSKSVYASIHAELSDKPVEEFWVLLLNAANFLIKKQFISSGGLTSTLADPQVIFRAAIEHRASGIVLAHNHPSGQLIPSAQDIKLTKKLIEGGKSLNIKILDHLIVAGRSYLSFVDTGLISTH